MQFVPQYFVIFEISSTRMLALGLQCEERAWTKNSAQNSPKHVISIEKLIFMQRASPNRSPVVQNTPSHIPPLAPNQVIDPPFRLLQPDLRACEWHTLTLRKALLLLKVIEMSQFTYKYVCPLDVNKILSFFQLIFLELFKRMTGASPCRQICRRLYP